MTFSGALRLTDLNDYITPSQACIKPVEQVPSGIQKAGPGAATTEIQIDSSGQYHEVLAESSTTSRKLEQAQISLTDCLACSGCITSAESVLITLQSHAEVLNFLNLNATSAEKKIAAISISPQSLASLAASVSTRSKQSVTPRQILRRVRAFCKQALGFEHVFDTTFARHIALNEHVKEFLERRSHSHQLPMLASACPGWICYAEKTRPEMLPFISAAKSPQQVMGSLVKNWMGTKWNRLPHEIYHVTVMPCYDKKLEASRNDFYNEVYATRDVDCVITTGELEQLMNEKDWDLSQPVPGELEPEPQGTECEEMLPELMLHPGTSSGSYLQSIIDRVVQDSPVPLTLDVNQVRHEDYEEITVRQEGEEGRIVFSGAKCYGFRNLQNLVRKVGNQSGVRVGSGAAGRLGERRRTTANANKRGYDYVEVMACPGGCVNGGGQLKPSVDAEGYPCLEDEPSTLAVRWANKEWTKKVEERYWGDERRSGQTERAEILMETIVGELCPTDEGVGDVHVCEEKDLCRNRLFRTQYRAVESDVVGIAVQW